jgi:hypothetical protein
VKARKVEASRRVAAGRVLQRPSVPPAALALWTCPDCGRTVTNPRHVRCDACIAADPAQAPEIRGRRGAAIAARKRALSEWDKANPDAVYDPELFRREILPRLGSVPLAEIRRRPVVARRPRRTSGVGNGRRMCRRGVRSACWSGLTQPALYAR